MQCNTANSSGQARHIWPFILDIAQTDSTRLLTGFVGHHGNFSVFQQKQDGEKQTIKMFGSLWRV